jgi:hypothetical protein
MLNQVQYVGGDLLAEVEGRLEVQLCLLGACRQELAQLLLILPYDLRRSSHFPAAEDNAAGECCSVAHRVQGRHPLWDRAYRGGAAPIDSMVIFLGSESATESFQLVSAE